MRSAFAAPRLRRTLFTDDEQWTRKFDTSQDLLGKLAAEARADRTGGRVTDVDPDRL